MVVTLTHNVFPKNFNFEILEFKRWEETTSFHCILMPGIFFQRIYNIYLMPRWRQKKTVEEKEHGEK
jgi:hypothetical protein